MEAPTPPSLCTARGSECLQTLALCSELFSLRWEPSRASCQRGEGGGEGGGESSFPCPEEGRNARPGAEQSGRAEVTPNMIVASQRNVIEGVHLFSQALCQGCRFCPEETEQHLEAGFTFLYHRDLGDRLLNPPAP